MSNIYLVRHGQASFGAANYDQLSELGYQQSRWLGEYFEQQGIHFNRIVSGGQQRHLQTTESICSSLSQATPIETMDGFNEFNFNALLAAYLERFPEKKPDPQETDRNVFYRLLIKSIYAWSEDALGDELPESWQQFKDRVQQSLEAVQNTDGESNTLVVSSGGAISLATALILDAPVNSMISLNLQLRNTGVCRLRCINSRINLFSYNEMAHLDQHDRHHARTFS